MNKEFWDTRWRVKNVKYNSDYSPPAFNCWGKFLPKNNNLTCLEIGCVPGKLLIFLNKRFGYKIKGVDYSDAISLVEENFKSNSIYDYSLYHEDFLNLPLGIKADIVISLGFIEHFHNFQDVIEKHANHVANNGFLVITVPNFRFFQYCFHSIFDKQVLRNHVLGVMRPKLIRDILIKCNLEILECRYYETFNFWCDTVPEVRLQRIFREQMLRATIKVKNVLKRLKLGDIPNRYFSPWIVCVAKKK